MKKNNNLEVEELVLDAEELEIVEKYNMGYYNYPVLFVSGENVITFNSKAEPLLGEAITWFTTPEFVVGMPSKPGSKNSYVVRKYGSSSAIATTLPIVFKEKGIKRGHRKIYKYKNGIAFKRYEILEEA